MDKSDTSMERLEQRDFRSFDPKLAGRAFDGFVHDVLVEVRLSIMAKRIARGEKNTVIAMPTRRRNTALEQPARARSTG
jgi:hypothetical protein